MASNSLFQYHLWVTVLFGIVFIRNEGLTLDLRDKPVNQSSTYHSNTKGPLYASFAVDDDIHTFSHTNCDSGVQWWRVDLEAIFCLTKITIVNRKDNGWRLGGAVVRAGLNFNFSGNRMIGSSVTDSQAQNGAIIDFMVDPIVSARYVSVHLDTDNKCLQLAEVMVEEINTTAADTITATENMDFAVVANPALLGQTGDNDAVITAYRVHSDIAACVSFNRLLTTGGRNEALPKGSMAVADPPTARSSTLRITLPEAGGIDRTGVFYSEAVRNGTATRIPIIILPKNESGIHLRPLQRTQIANIGDAVVLRMLNVNAPSNEYRWRHNGGNVSESWNNQLNVSIMNVTMADEGVYTCFASGHEQQQLHAIMRLIVRGCPAGMWNRPSCQNTCPHCYNGGVCDDKTGRCICAPGFSGGSCEQIYGRHVFGQNARQSCSDSSNPHNDACRGRLFCLPDPYGCSCAAGYTGLDCMQECVEGMYGADCKQTCHCAPGGTCKSDTGECSQECQPPYYGRNCQCSTQLSIHDLKVTVGPVLIVITWQPDPCSSGYNLSYALTKRGKFEQIASPERQEILSGETARRIIPLTTLESCAEYTIYISPLYNGSTHGPEESTSVRIPRKNETTSVSSFEWASEDPFSLTLSWAPVICADFYELKYALSNRDGCESINPVTNSTTSTYLGNTTKTTISGLMPNSKYEVQIKASVNGSFGQTCVSDLMTNTSEPSKPPINVTVTSLMQRKLSFSWMKPPCGGRRGVITSYPYKLITSGSPTRGFTSYENVTIDELIPFTNYSFQVAANTNAGAGPYSASVTAQTREAEPTVPLDVGIQDADDVSILLVWSQPNPAHGLITRYNIRYWSAGYMNTTMVNVNVTQLMHRINNLTTNTMYLLQVQAVTSVGAGPWSNAVNATTIIGVPGPIRNLIWTERKELAITLDWDPPIASNGKIQNYRVEYRILEKPYQPDFTAEDTYLTRTTASAPFTVDNLKPGTKYQFRIAANNQVHTGIPDSIEVYTRPKSDISAPEQPQIYLNEATDTTVTIGLVSSMSYDDEYITSYVIHVKKITTSVRKRDVLDAKDYMDSPDEYIAAELPKTVPEKFVVGDSIMYGGYYNAPLQTGAGYEIRVGSVSKGDEMEVFVTYTMPINVTVMRQLQTQPPSGIVAAVVVVVIIVIICFVIIVIVYKRRRINQAKQPSDVDGVMESSDIPLEQKADTIPDTSTARKPKPAPKPRQNQTETQPVRDEKESGIFTPPPPVRLEDLAEYIRIKESAGRNDFEADYKTLPTGQLHPSTVAQKAENREKNRYVNVAAYDYSRVVLEPLQGDPHSDYINACYIDGYHKENKYIASQGPNKGSLKDIWRMVWQLNVDKIIMLTNPVENGKVKCVQYWADAGTSKYSDVVVTTDTEEVFLDYTIRNFSIHQVGSKDVRSVKQFHYTTWPDMKPPEYPAPLLNFMSVVNADHNEGRTVIHCSAGVGRTGTYIALDSMLEQMKQEGQVDVLGFVHQMRQKRIKMVQTSEQYKFIFDALLAVSLSGVTAYRATDFRQKLTALKKLENGAQDTGMKKQFETLSKLSAGPGSDNSMPKSGQLPENVDKNRFPDFVPSDRTRPYLMTRARGNEANYINANFLPGYRRKNRYIGTQMPMPNTVADFWRMVYDHKAACVVMLNTLDAGDETIGRYWPDDGIIEFDPLVIELSQIMDYKGVTCRTFTVVNKKSQSEAARTVTQFQYHDWPSDEVVTSSLQGMLTLMELTEKQLRDTGPIVVHCIDGLGPTSVFCTLMTLLEQFKVEKAVDVFQTVHRFRMANHNMMYSEDQYAMCYDVFQTYLNSATIYENYTSPAEDE